MADNSNLSGDTLTLLQRNLDKPVTLINLMKFWDRAQYVEAIEGKSISGCEAYEAYLAIAKKILESLGAQMLVDTPSHPLVLENCINDWDRIIIVSYPSARAVLELGAIPQYAAALKHRSAAIAQNITLCAF